MNRFRFLVRPAWIVAAAFGVFLAARLALLATWRASFADLAPLDLARALAHGFVIDASILAVTLGGAVVALLVPLRFAARPAWRATWTWLAFAVLCVHALVLAGDIAYFGTVGRHVGPELVSFVDDPALMTGLVLESYLLPLCGVLAALCALGFLWRRWMRLDARADGPAGPRAAPPWALIALAPLLVVAIRGNVTGKPIGTVDAFASGSVSAGYLALNGPFSIVHSIPNADDLACEFLPWDEAVANVRAQVLAPEERALDDGFPLLRARAPSGASRPNVVVLLLESWDADVVDAVRAEHGLPALGLTPNFDALSRSGVLFTSFYAAGQRSMHGLFAVLAGLPSLPGLPYLGNGIEQSRLSYLGKLALAEGYSTHFLQGSHERSFRIDAVAALAGFEQYLGKEGIAERTGRPSMARWGAWDGDLLVTAHQLFVAARKPFLGMAFTTTTHPPFQVPEGHPKPYPDDTEEHSYWNSVHYADHALGEYFAAARAAGYYDDTVFVLVADHRSGLGHGKLSFPEMHHVPCLVLAPGLAPRIERGVRSQLDVLPTIAELAHWTTEQATLGRSLLDPSTPERGAVCMRSELLLRIESGGWIVHDLGRRLKSKALAPEVDLDALERRLLAAVQVTVTALQTNRVAPAPRRAVE